MNKEVVKCFNCSNMNEVKVSSGHNKLENKGRKYFTCANCNQFQWVENGVAVSNSGFTKTDYSKTAKVAPVMAQKQQITREPVKDTDWDAIARGKVRNSVAVAFIPLVGALTPDYDMIEVMESWVEWIMTGKQTKNEDVEEIDLPSERFNKEQEEINAFRDKSNDPES